GVERAREAAARALGHGLDLDLVLPGARRRAVGQEVIAARRGLDALSDLVEPLLDVAAVLRRERPRAPDAPELPAIDLLPDADDVGLEARAVERAVDLVGAGAVGAVGAV